MTLDASFEPSRDNNRRTRQAVRIHITGASGSGTSTLGRALAASLGGTHLESDDYFWLPTSPPYREKRDKQERLKTLTEDLNSARVPVLAGSIVGWGREVEDGFDVIVFLHIDPIIRLERLEKREIARFGQIDPEFLAWAARYDTGPTDMRSLAMHREWLAQRDCRVIRLVGDMSVEERVARVLEGI